MITAKISKIFVSGLLKGLEHGDTIRVSIGEYTALQDALRSGKVFAPVVGTSAYRITSVGQMASL